MDKDTLIRRLMKTFLVELDEHVRAFDRDLMVLERNPSPEARTEAFRNLFRTGHSLKGAARAVNIDLLESAGHYLESLFAAARDGVINLDTSLFDLLFATADAIKDVGRRLGGGEDISTSPLTALLPRLKSASFNLESASLPSPMSSSLPSARTPPPLAEPPITPVVEGVPTSAPIETDVADVAPVYQARDSLVRISSTRLDRLVAFSGELRVARGRMSVRDADVDQLSSLLKQWQADWSSAERALRKHRHPTSNDGLTLSKDEDSKSEERVFELGLENFKRLAQQLNQLSGNLIADRKALDQIAGALEEEVIRARMVPFSDACEGLDRAVRDLAKESGKEINLTVEGGDIEFDRSVVAGIKNALLHLVRNAVDHGIESPVERLATGKTAHGSIVLKAGLRQGRVEIAITDNGRGFDLEAIRLQLRRRGLTIPEDERALLRMAFTPAFSTSATLTHISGRGVGLDVVKTAVESLRGSYDVSFEAGRGSRIVLSVPLTLTKLRALLVRAGNQTYAFDTAAIYALRRISLDDLKTIEGRDVLMIDGSPVPVLRLLSALGQEEHESHAAVGGKLPVVIVQEGVTRVAFTVDELLSENEVVVKDLGSRLSRAKNVSGATVLPTGRVAIILNAADLVRGATEHGVAGSLSEMLAGDASKVKTRILIADDSVTTRTLVKNILEAAGYEVIDAADGMEAWQFLQDKSVDLVVSDVEMPRMDGFALTQTIRNSKRHQKLPVILVTALETEQDKMRGLDAGANAYLPKSGFDQTNLIEVIEQFV